MVRLVEIKWHPGCSVHTTVYIPASPVRVCLSVCVNEIFVTHRLTFNPTMKVVSNGLHVVSFSIGGLLYRGAFHLLSNDAHAS